MLTNIAGINTLRKIVVPLTKSIALEVAEAEELDRDCSNKYHPQKWRPAVVGTEVIPVVTQPIDPQLLVLK